MIRDYMLVSPSLDGVLSHDELHYEGVARPKEIRRILDGPSKKDLKRKEISEADLKVLSQYFHDLYGAFMKRLSYFAIGPEIAPEEELKLVAMLQELIKIKKMG